MLERIAAKVASRLLGEFCADIDADSLSVSVLKGEVKLQNVELKPAAFDAFDLPVTVKHGAVKSINVTVPWGSLSSSPVKVEMHDVRILVRPNRLASAEDLAAWEERSMEDKLRTLEQALERQRLSLQSSSVSNTDTTATVLLKNLILKITDLNIRYIHVDDSQPMTTPFILGLHLGGITVDSANDTREPISIGTSDPNPGEESSGPNPSSICKEVGVSDVQLYWATTAPGCPKDATANDDVEEVGRTSLLDISSASLWVTMVNHRNAVDLKQPPMSIELESAPVRIQLDQLISRDIMAAMNEYSMLALRRTSCSPNAHTRPKCGYRGHEREWWSFAIHSTMLIVRQRRKQCTWEHMAACMRTARIYSALYEKALLDNLDTGEKEEMTRIERAEAVEFLYIIRAQCAHKLKRNLRRALSSDENTTETKEAVTSAASPTPGFFGRMYKRFTGSLPSENKTSLTIAGQNLELSEEDVAALRNFSEQIVETEKLVEAEPAFVQFQACIKISEVSLSLLDAAAASQQQQSVHRQELTRFQVEGIVMEEVRRVKGCSRRFSIAGIEIDPCSNDVAGSRSAYGEPGGEVLKTILSFDSSQTNNKLLDLHIDHQPVDEAWDEAVRCVCAPIVITLQPQWLQILLTWARDVASQIEESSVAMDKMRKSVQQGLVYGRDIFSDALLAKRGHCRRYFNFDLSFPTVIFPSRNLVHGIPETRANAASLAIVQMGCVQCTTEPSSDGSIKYALSLQDLNLKLCSATENWREFQSGVIKKPFTAHVTLETTGEPSGSGIDDRPAETVQRLRATAVLEPVETELSVEKVQHVTEVVTTFSGLMESTASTVATGGIVQGNNAKNVTRQGQVKTTQAPTFELFIKCESVSIWLAMHADNEKGGHSNVNMDWRGLNLLFSGLDLATNQGAKEIFTTFRIEGTSLLLEERSEGKSNKISIFSSQQESRSHRRMYKIAAQLEAAFRRFADAQGLIRKDQLSELLKNIGLVVSQTHLQLLQSKIDHKEKGEIDVEAFVQLAVFLVYGQTRNEIRVDVPSLRVQERTTFMTVKSYGSSRDNRLCLDVGRLEVDVRTCPLRFLVSWLEEVSASRMKMPKESSSSSEMNSRILRGLELLRGSFESEEEEIFLPPCSNRQLSIHIQQVDCCVHDHSAGQAAFFVLFEDIAFQNIVSLPTKKHEMYKIYTESKVRLQVSHAKHKNAVPDEDGYDNIVPATTLTLAVQKDIPVDVGNGSLCDARLEVLNDLRIDLSLTHLVFADALAKAFASMLEGSGKEGEADAGFEKAAARMREEVCAAQQGNDSRGPKARDSWNLNVKKPKYKRNLARLYRSVLLNSITLSLWDDLSFDVEENEFLEGDDDEEKRMERKKLLVLSATEIQMKEELGTDKTNIDLQLRMQMLFASRHSSTCLDSVIEPVPVDIKIEASRKSNLQSISVDIPQRIEVSIAPDHVRMAKEALTKFNGYSRFLKRFASGQARVLLHEHIPLSISLANLLADLSPSEVRTFRNCTDLSIKIRAITNDSPAPVLETMLRPLASIDIPVSILTDACISLQPVRRQKGSRQVGGDRQVLADGPSTFDVRLRLNLELKPDVQEAILQGGDERRSLEEKISEAIKLVSEQPSAHVVVDEVKASDDNGLKVSCTITFALQGGASYPLLFPEGKLLGGDKLEECLHDVLLLNDEQEVTLIQDPHFITAVDCSSHQLPNTKLLVMSREDAVFFKEPWRMVNLLPSPATISLYTSPETGETPVDTFTLGSGAEQAQFSTVISEGLYITLSFEEYASVSPVHVTLSGGTKNIQDIAMQDKKGTLVNAKFQISANGREGQVMLKVFVQTVLVNRSGLPLVVGRCLNGKKGQTKSELEVEIAAGSHEMNTTHRKRWHRMGDTHVVSFALEDEGVSWNELESKQWILDVPRGWSPCITLASSMSADSAAETPWVMLTDVHQFERDTAGDMDEDSEEGHQFSIQIPGSPDLVHEMDDEAQAAQLNGCTFHLGVNVRKGIYPFHRTMYLDVVPQRTLVNESGLIMQVCQEGNEQVLAQLSPGCAMSTLGIFNSTLNSKRVQFRLLNIDGQPITLFSRPFSMEYKSYSFPLRLPAAATTQPPDDVDLQQQQPIHVVCLVRRHLGANFLKVTRMVTPRYLIVNETSKTFNVWQTHSLPGDVVNVTRVGPCSEEPFSWDSPDVEHAKMISVSVSGEEDAEPKDINIKAVGQEGLMCGKQIVWSTSIINSHTRVLEFSDPQEEEQGEEDARGDVLVVTGNIAGVGVSLVNENNEEVLYATLIDIKPSFRARVSPAVSRLDLSIGRFQIDNQTRLGTPVAIVCPHEDDEATTFLHAQLERNMSITSMAYWNLVRVKVGTLLVDVYEAWLHALLTLEGLAQVSKTMEDDHFDLDQVSAATGQLHENEATLHGLVFLNDESVDFNRTFFERLELSSFEGEVSAHGLSSAALRDTGSNGPIAAIYAHLGAINETLSDVEKQHIKLPMLLREDLATASNRGGVQGLLWKHYKHVIISTLTRMLVSHAMWMLENAGEGQNQLLRKQTEEAKAASEQASGLGEGLEKGFKNLGDSLAEGLVGVITKPLDGASSGGLIGFYKGMSTGLIGAFAKPLAAVADFNTVVGDALDSHIRRARIPRAVYSDRMLRGYLYSHAVAHDSLKGEETALHKSGKHREAERLRRMRRSFVAYYDAQGESGVKARHGSLACQSDKCQGDKCEGLLLANGLLMVVGPRIGQVQQQVAFNDIRTAVYMHNPPFTLEITTKSNTNLKFSASALGDSERDELLHFILACAKADLHGYRQISA